ncbi:MAG: metallophosphoesterase [Clostridia bacterium]|nr:metallophosphoesterase [Clostridia bacterium]
MIIKHYHVQTDKKIQMTICLLADIHGFPMEHFFYTALKECKPDTIIIAGDLVDEHRPFSDTTELLLKTCIETAPTYFAYGNNDEVLTDQNIQKMKALGTIVLDNTWTEIHPHIFVGGLTSAMVLRNQKYGLHAKEKVETETAWLQDFSKLDGYKILIDHHPENYRLYTQKQDIDLILSGHTHGGQISIFGYGLLVPGQRRIWPRYSGGFYEHKLIVSRGLSNSLPIPRIGNPTELVCIHIINKEAKIRRSEYE